jgi:hypothetical protein
MLSKTPYTIAQNQTNYPYNNLAQLNKDIEKHGQYLSSGQILFHGGAWSGNYNIGEEITLQKPLSTSLSPYKATMNAIHNGKAFNSGCLDLFVLKIAKDNNTKAFIYRINGSTLGHEKEVLMETGIKLKITNINIINKSFLVSKTNKYLGLDEKKVPFRVIEIDVY